jgi:hypothetical protein
MFWGLHSGRIYTWLQSRYFLRMVAPSDHLHDYRYVYIRDWLFWLMFFLAFLTVFRRKVG